MFKCLKKFKIISLKFKYIQRVEKESREQQQPNETNTNHTKSLETECQSLRASQRTLTTSCLILIGIMKPLIQSNNDLKEQRQLLDRIFSKWYITQRQLNYENVTVIKEHATPSLITQKIQNFDLADAVDYSIDSSILTEASENKNFISTSTDIKTKTLNDFKPTRIGLFRKAVIVVLATNRLVYFSKQNKNTKYSVQDLKCHVIREFIYDENIENKHSFTQIIQSEPNKASKSTDKKNEANRIQSIKGLFSKANDNAELLKINEISTELNRHFFNDTSPDKPKQTSQSVRNTTEKLRETIKNCFYVLETNKSNYSPTNDTDSELVIALRKGLQKLCSLDSKLGVYYSFRKKISAANSQSIDCKPALSQTETNDINVKSFAAELNELRDHRADIVPLVKFESVCKELEESLKREEQGQVILNKQSYQIEDLNKRLAKNSDEAVVTKLKDVSY